MVSEANFILFKQEIKLYRSFFTTYSNDEEVDPTLIFAYFM
jgi:hypothetical protein